MLNKQLARGALQQLSEFFLVLHAVLFILFLFFSVLPLMCASLLCAGLCIMSILALRREMMRTQLVLLYASSLLETALAVCLLGWDGDFQLCLILLVILSFCSEYIGRTAKLAHFPGLPPALLAAAVYLLLLLYTNRNVPPISLSSGQLSFFRMFWGLVVIGFIVVFLYLFVRLTTHSEKVLADKASIDKLTGLFNRAGYDRILAEMDLDRTILLLFDTDKFKAVNDTYGHETGDRVLVAISKEIRQNFRAQDCVCRIGGDEFVVLMFDVEGDQRELIRRKVSRINRELAHPPDNLPIVSMSVGVAFGAQEPDAKTLFAHADEALYRVKQAGGRDCIFYGG